ncbi:hypothetical protein B0H10DRAFT_2187346 [Mycena sp. CBHHK59/15]|nr:hypothetical protein B0H10DRAFT_2187346 [Mycena sp. CBHHK59/15]
MAVHHGLGPVEPGLPTVLCKLPNDLGFWNGKTPQALYSRIFVHDVRSCHAQVLEWLWRIIGGALERYRELQGFCNGHHWGRNNVVVNGLGISKISFAILWIRGSAEAMDLPWPIQSDNWKGVSWVICLRGKRNARGSEIFAVPRLQGAVTSPTKIAPSSQGHKPSPENHKVTRSTPHSDKILFFFSQGINMSKDAGLYNL